MTATLHLVTNDVLLADPTFERKAHAAITAGGSHVAFHLRGPRTSGRVLYRVGRAIRDASRAVGGLFLVNDRIDIALVLAADGVHLGRRSVGVPVARGLLAPSALVGRSVHGVDDAEDAAGADYVFVGPVYRTGSHPDRPAVGAGAIGEMVGALPGTPVFAIGGLTVDRIGAVMEAGAAGIAVIGAWWEASEPAEAVAALTRRLVSESVQKAGAR